MLVESCDCEKQTIIPPLQETAGIKQIKAISSGQEIAFIFTFQLLLLEIFHHQLKLFLGNFSSGVALL